MAFTMAPTRQPFANLDSPRFNALMRSKLNLQNQQNGLASLPKNHQPEKDPDTENIDPLTPNAFKQPPKRKRDSEETDSPKPTKTTRTQTVQTTPRAVTTTTTTPKPFCLNPPSTPKSAPILKPAGRSPQSQPRSCKPFGRSAAKPLSTNANANTNANTNTNSSSKKKSVLRPFSLATALSNGKPKPKPQPTTTKDAYESTSNNNPPLKPRTNTNTKPPGSWFFDIHVDAEEEEMTNLMQHSTCVLDISDDENGKGMRGDKRGKENIPPVEMGVSNSGIGTGTGTGTGTRSARTSSRKTVIMEDGRAPLGELDATDFYGEGCHAFSYAVVSDDGDGDESASENGNIPEKGHEKSSSSTSHSRRASGLQNVASIEGVLYDPESGW